jgi:hypothetical protein
MCTRIMKVFNCLLMHAFVSVKYNRNRILSLIKLKDFIPTQFDRIHNWITMVSFQASYIVVHVAFAIQSIVFMI